MEQTHYHVTVMTTLPGIVGSIHALSLDAHDKHRRLVQLILDFGGGIIASEIYGRTVFLNGDVITTYSCTKDACDVPKEEPDETRRYKLDFPSVESYGKQLVDMAKMVQGASGHISILENEGDRIEAIINSVPAQSQYVDMDKVRDICAEKSSQIIKAFQLINDVICDLVAAFNVFRVKFLEAYEDIFSGLVHLGRELRRSATYGAKKVLHIQSPSIRGFEPINWHLPQRPCRKLYEIYNRKIFFTNKRRK